MKPRTKLQKTVASLYGKLPPISSYQINQAINEFVPKMGSVNKRLGHGQCMVCGGILDKEHYDLSADKVQCKHCGSHITIDRTRQRVWTGSAYFTIITKKSWFQVIRVYFISWKCKKGDGWKVEINELFQRWITPDGQSEIVGVTKMPFSYYYDAWCLYSEFTLRKEHDAHISYGKIIGTQRLIPELKRNGYNGDCKHVNPHRLFTELLKNPKIETLWKAGQYDLVKHMVDNRKSFNSHWGSVKVALRHKYQIEDVSVWFDMLNTMTELGKDTHNPKLILPQNLLETHDMYLAQLRAKNERERRERQRQKMLRQMEEIKEDNEKETKYTEKMSKFFHLRFEDNDITLEPLKSVAEFITESYKMHHCVYDNKYYEKEDTLILHALRNGESIATIEYKPSTLSVMQCRGKYNSVPEHKERILNLLEANKKQIAKAI